MKLQHLTDKVLHLGTLKLAAAEREASTQMLHHLREVDRRKLFSDYKCSGLFDYCVRLLGYSEGSAQRRIVAARLLDEFPQLEDKIEKGVLTLTNISQANQYFRENQIEQAKDKMLVLKGIENLSKNGCEKKLFEMSGKEKEVKETKKRISSNKTYVSIVLSDETLVEVEKLKALLGKDLSMDELIKYMAATAIEKVEKQKFKQTSRPRSLSPEKVKRTPGTAIKREVYHRDKKCVQCGGLHHLNYDHRRPWALGGETSIENMRLLCFNCNQRARISVFGALTIPPPASG